MKIKSLLLFFTIVFSAVLQTEAQDKSVLFTVDNEPVYTSEFLRVYNKNLDLVKDETQKDINAYLELFIDYKLKLKEAKSLGLDKKPNYLRELDGYKKQLSKNYLIDNEVTDALVEEAYSRLKIEVNASHILVKIDENASAKDTLAAYNEILKLRNRVVKEGYKQVQKDVHNGKTIYAEDLGYFSAFKMVYPFETAAFKTAVGEVSKPFRTRFGYHVVTVFNKREAQGEVSVAHIMIKTDAENDEESKTKIDEIYKRIEQGEAFDGLSKQLSEDKSTAAKGGLLKPFSSGQLSAPEFEKQAFMLNNVNDISKPFKTQFGWHIIKLKAKKGIAALEEMKPQLEAKIKRDSRSKVISDSRVKTLKAKYSIIENKNAINYFKSILTEDFYNRRWQLPSDFTPDKVLVKIQDKEIIYNAFGQFLIKTQRNLGFKSNSFEVVINKAYSSFLENELLTYQEENLINENEDYAQIVSEYRDGLLLFDLMETEIWNAAKNDSVALKAYFNANKNSYFFPERVKAVVASSANKSVIKKVSKLMGKGTETGAIKNLVNTNNKINVSFTSGEFNKEHQALPTTFSFKNGVSKVYKHNDAYVVVNVEQILDTTLKTFEEAKGKAISDYQKHKETLWLKDLANKYKVIINEDVLKTVKQKINK